MLKNLYMCKKNSRPGPAPRQEFIMKSRRSAITFIISAKASGDFRKKTISKKKKEEIGNSRKLHGCPDNLEFCLIVCKY